VATRVVLGGQTPIVQRTARVLCSLVLACLAAGIGAAVVGRSASPQTASVGALAMSLARGHAEQVEQLLSPAVRSQLPASRLTTDWQVAVAGAGQFQRVVRTVTVNEGPIHHELEVLSFANGTGTLSAWRTSKGITALWLMAGTPFDAHQAQLAAGYAKDLVAGDYAGVTAAFDPQVASALPEAKLAATTQQVDADLTPGSTVIAQVTVLGSPDTVVETYLLFKNGLRRVEISFDDQQRIAGLYIHSI
jgi:hypothetical protein